MSAPNASGYLETDGDGPVALYWEERGNPDGHPVVVLHGGPGGGARASLADLFDPTRWRIILYDQRGCGRSRPHAADCVQPLRAACGMAAHLADLSALVGHLALGDHHLYGTSWGATLALRAAQTDPSRRRGLILGSVTSTSAAEIDWLYGGVRRFVPEAFAVFAAPFPHAAPGRALVRAYGDALAGSEAQAHAERWCVWEEAVVALAPGYAPSARWQDPRFRMAFARLCAWTFGDLAGMGPREVLDDLPRLADLPVEMVHSRLDLSAPPDTAAAIAAALPQARLTLLPGGLHSATSGDMAVELRAATDRMADAIT